MLYWLYSRIVASFSGLPTVPSDAISVCDSTVSLGGSDTQGWIMTPEYGDNSYENDLDCEIQIPHNSRPYLFIDVFADVSLTNSATNAALIPKLNDINRPISARCKIYLPYQELVPFKELYIIGMGLYCKASFRGCCWYLSAYYTLHYGYTFPEVV